MTIGGIDPHLLRIVTARRAPESRERVAAISRLVTRRGDRVDDVGILRIHVHAAVVTALSVPYTMIGRVHLTPTRAAVVRAIKAVVVDQKDALGIGVHCDGHRSPSIQAGQATASQLTPRHAFVRRLVERGAGAPCVRPCRAARIGAGSDVMPNGCREDHSGSVERTCQLLDTRLVVDVERLRPVFAAIGASIDATRVAPPPQVSLRCDHYQIRIVRIDEHRRDLGRRIEAEVLPRSPGVDGLVDAIALVERTRRHLAGTDVDDIRV